MYVEGRRNRFTRFTRFTFESCPLRSLNNTALETLASTPSELCAIGNLTTRAEDGSRIVQLRGLVGGVQGAAGLLSESDISSAKESFVKERSD